MKLQMVPAWLRLDARNLMISQETVISELAEDLSNTLKMAEMKKEIERFENYIDFAGQLQIFPEIQVEKFKKVAQRYKDLVRKKELALLERIAH